MRKITEIIIHCTATPEGRPVDVNTIRRWHRDRGWNDIGYHYVVMLDGTVEGGRLLQTPGGHCQGHNANSIGIAYVGGMTADGLRAKDTRTPAQRAALRRLVADLLQRFPRATVHGHREFAAKACPSFDIADL